MRINKSLWFIVILVLLLGILIVDGSAILFGKWQLGDMADAAASDAAAAYRTTKSIDALTVIAQQSLDDHIQGATVTHLETDPETGAVTITVKKTAGTLFVKHISALKSWTQLKATATATAPLG